MDVLKPITPSSTTMSHILANNQSTTLSFSLINVSRNNCTSSKKLPSSSSRLYVTRKNDYSYPTPCIDSSSHVQEEEEEEMEGLRYNMKQATRIIAPNSCPFTPLGFLERAAIVYGDCASIVYKDTIFTWSETHIRCLKLASSIASLGLGKGDVISVVAPNIPAMYELHFAIPMANAILNAINLKLDSRTISILLQHSGSKLVFVDYQSISLLVEAISYFPLTKKQPLLVLINNQDDHQEEEDNSTPNGFHHDTYEAMVRKGNPGFVWEQPESEWDSMTLNYTSGTTSSPKGVVHSHRARFLLTMDGLVDWGLPKQSVYLWTLPMFHANGWNYTWGTAAVGATNICLRGVDPISVYDAIKKYRVTHMCGAPAVLNMLSNYQNAKPLENPVHILTAGAPPPAVVLSRAESLGFIVSHGYGLTETAGLIMTCAWKSQWDTLPASERAEKKARQGVRTAGFAQVDVVDAESGVSVKRDGITMGEVVVRGASVMLGYLNDPEGTSNCMRNGWLYTGDVGVIHPDGYMEIKDRSKDVIICGGENMSSVEVESVLYTHPAVNEAAVVARPDKFWGETPCAFVSLKPDILQKPSEKQIREFCKSRMPLYMVPRTIVVLKDELPKTSTGKVQKFLLRDMAKSLTARH